ncbi:MAG: right-handed parallel beta-helix repeat-containing protein [Planctomycetes bacterium]|nr:right-handed parallel beta-helix repeat-containing protein [Planctomycetota bacterium]
MASRRKSLALFILCAAVLAIVSAGSAPRDEPSLAGARPDIEAIRFRTIQDAIDALPAEGGVVRLPAGIFEIARPLRISSEDVCLVGAGTATHIRNTNAEGEPALVLAPPPDETKKQKYLWRIRLADFRITGNEKSGDGIVATNIDELFIDGVTVSYHGGCGIRMTNCYEDPRVVNSLITYNKATGLLLEGCHDIVVAANQFEENADALRCLDGYNLCMTGNCLDDHLADGVVIENTYGSVLAGNMIEECRGTAIVLDRDCYGIALSANVIAHETGGGIDLRDAHGCAVGANAFPIVKKNALLIGPASGRIAVAGNAFSDSTIGPGQEKRGAQDQDAGGIVLWCPEDVAIAGNLFSGLRPKAVEGMGERILFAGNVIAESESDHAELAGLVVGNLEEPPPPRDF